MPEKKITGVRLPAEMFQTIEDMYFNRACGFNSRSECARVLLEQGFQALSENPDCALPQIKISGTSKDISIQLSAELFEKLEDFRYSRRIASRALAVRIVLSYGWQNYQQGQLALKR